MRKKTTDALVQRVTMHFRTFGGGQTSDWNPLVAALKDHAPSFAAGVDVREVVEFILEELK